ncbi:hypothetical protein RMSM_05973 [Rhodopirellula maiorica SM1]|uniref:CYTH domain-containing protein n=1 Tax=Rhodopirellula maiorica SM1 TaxID=1265738 RepID=M5RSZ8_9BACT|nr:hypothetical protein [Rhodopirellula maiorica]EMI17099.1 hypothetical protein RMSM_05973 [Rhodopirellula maiorica SM1]
MKSKSTLPVISREYKVMLDPRLFDNAREGLEEVKADLKRQAKRFDAKVSGRFDKFDQRTIRFLDTPDFSFRNNQLILRHRRPKGSSSDGEFTLKCRSEDRYLAAAADLRPAKKLNGKFKFEEDIAAPFRSRFSHSVTIASPTDGLPETVAKASRLFPLLGKLPRDGGRCEGKTPVLGVNDFVPHEQVRKGLKLTLTPDVDCSVAVILWSHTSKGRILCAEFSFRYRDKKEQYPAAAAQTAYDLFAAIQKLDWCHPNGVSKTQFAYQG